MNLWLRLLLGILTILGLQALSGIKHYYLAGLGHSKKINLPNTSDFPRKKPGWFTSKQSLVYTFVLRRNPSPKNIRE
jgi:hypothetical protein